MEPVWIGNSTLGVPSEKDSVAFLSLILAVPSSL
jgi:hypothetical protein